MEADRLAGAAGSLAFFKFTQSPEASGRSSSEGHQGATAFTGLDSILDDDDDFELTFSLDVQQRAAAEALAQSRQALRSEEYRQLFHLPPDEVLVQDFNCALQKKILLQGHMYLFEHYVCFYSNIFGYEKKKVIILKDVTSVRKARTAGLFPNAIEIVAWGKRSFFASFLSRDEAYRLIVEGWARNSRNAIIDSDSQSNHSPLINNHIHAAQEEHEACISEASFESREIVEVPAAVGDEVDHLVDNILRVNEVQVTEVLSSPEDPSQNEETKNNIHVGEGDAPSESNLWEGEDEDAPNVPDGYKTILEFELPIHVKDFFLMFFSDSSNFFESFHSKCGDQDFRRTNWAKSQQFSGHVRDVSFRHPVKVYFGPKASNCQEVQRYRIYRNSHLIIETSQQMNDIPYGDYFHVEGRWDVVPLNGKATPHCAVRVYSNVAFSKKTVWRGKIEQGTYDECKEVYATWLAEALRYLQEKGLVDTQQTKFENRAQPAPTRSSGAQVKRKLDVGYKPPQGQKIPKTGPSSQAVKIRQNTQPSQVSPVKSLKDFHHTFSIAQFTSIDQNKLLFILLIMIGLFLIQTGIIIGLLRSSSKVRYIPLSTLRGRDYLETSIYGRLDSSLVEHSVRLLKEEMSIAEARLETMRYSLEILKANLKFTQKEVSSPG